MPVDESKESAKLERMRAEIDEIDEALLKLIARRRDVAVEIAKIKQIIGPGDDKERLEEVLKNVQKKSVKLGLDKDEMLELWKSLIAYIIKEQMKRYPY